MTTITFETVLTEQIGPLTRRAARMVGDAQTAEDLRQETLARAWRSAPRDMPAPALRAWLHRTTTNLALDELRRRRRRDEVALTDLGADRADVEPEAREALAALTAHERLVLLLRHEAGLSLRELGRGARHLRGRSAQARRARPRRVRRRARPLRADDPRPTILLLMGNEEPAAYVAWLERAGARVRVVDRSTVGPRHGRAPTGSCCRGARTTSIHASTASRAASASGPTDLHRDLRDLAALRSALRGDVPIVGRLPRRAAPQRAARRRPAPGHRRGGPQRPRAPHRGARRRHRVRLARPPRPGRAPTTSCPGITRRSGASAAACASARAPATACPRRWRSRRTASRWACSGIPSWASGRAARASPRPSWRRHAQRDDPARRPRGHRPPSPDWPRWTARTCPEGPLLIGLVDDEPWAVLALADGAAVADPFERSAAGRGAAARARAAARATRTAGRARRIRWRRRTDRSGLPPASSCVEPLAALAPVDAHVDRRDVAPAAVAVVAPGDDPDLPEAGRRVADHQRPAAVAAARAARRRRARADVERRVDGRDAEPVRVGAAAAVDRADDLGAHPQPGSRAGRRSR